MKLIFITFILSKGEDLGIWEFLGSESRTIYWVVTPAQDAIVTTRIINICLDFLVGDPEQNLHFPLESWEEGQPKLYILIITVESANPEDMNF